MQRRAYLGAILALGLAFSSSACVKDPVVSVYYCRVSGAQPRGVHLDVILKVKNKNSFDVKVRNVRVSTLLAERYRLPPIQFNPDQWLAAKRTTAVHVPVYIPWNVVPALLRATVSNSAIPYKVTGAADVTAVRALGFQRNDYPIEEEGEFSRAALLRSAQHTIRF